MKIRHKLLSIIFFMLLAMIFSILIFSLLQNTIKKIEDEKSLLTDLTYFIQKQHIELSRFLYDDVKIQEQMGKYKAIIVEEGVVFDQVRNISLLPRINSRIHESLQNINKLDEYQKKLQDKILKNMDELIEKNQRIYGSDKDFSIHSIKDEYFQLDIQLLKNFIANMDRTLENSESLILNQYHIINAEVSSLEKKSYIVMIFMISIVLIVTVVTSMIIIKKIASNIQSIGKNISAMSEGDLTESFIINSKDEIGILSNDMNSFQNDLRHFLDRLKELSLRNTEVKEVLISTTTESSAASIEISANIQSIDNQMSDLDRNITDSTNQVTEITGFIDELNGFVAEQISMIDESTSSLMQMISSISDVSHLTERNKNAMNSLVDTAQEGGEKLSETTAIIEEINSSVTQINGMADIIQSLSSQTNLLAMNAAIEAAHAGENGKGFAVVADEIRKLAEASADNSKMISKTLKEIISRIEGASLSGQSTKAAFDNIDNIDNIDNNVKGVSDALNAVSTSTKELDISGKLIIEAMTKLSNTSSIVQGKSQIMQQSSENVSEHMQQVSNISNSITGALSEINTGFSEVTDAVSGLQTVSDSIGSISVELDVYNEPRY